MIYAECLLSIAQAFTDWCLTQDCWTPETFTISEALMRRVLIARRRYL